VHITEDNIISDILAQDKTCAKIFAAHGMNCLGCPASKGETVGEACELHEIDCDELLKQLNAHLAAR